MLVPGAVGDAGLTVLSGPSGVGKGTVVAGLRKKRPDIWLSVSVTTRSPRPGEMDGREYHFGGINITKGKHADLTLVLKPD